MTNEIRGRCQVIDVEQSSLSLRAESTRLLAGEAVNRGSRFILLLLIAREVGAEEFGAWVVAVALATFLASTADAGLNTIVTREVAAAKSAAQRYLGAVRAALPLLACGAAAFLVLAALLLEVNSHLWLLLLLGLGAIFQSGGVILLAVHRGLGFLRQEGYVRAIEGLIFVAGGGSGVDPRRCCRLARDGLSNRRRRLLRGCGARGSKPIRPNAVEARERVGA